MLFAPFYSSFLDCNILGWVAGQGQRGVCARSNASPHGRDAVATQHAKHAQQLLRPLGAPPRPRASEASVVAQAAVLLPLPKELVTMPVSCTAGNDSDSGKTERWRSAAVALCAGAPAGGPVSAARRTHCLNGCMGLVGVATGGHCERERERTTTFVGCCTCRVMSCLC